MKRILFQFKNMISGDRDPKLKQLLKFFLLVLIVTLFARGMAADAAAGVRVISPLKKVVFASGVLNPVGSAEYSVPDGLLITQLKAETGDSISQGDVLALVDSQTLDELLIREEGQLRQMELQHEGLLDVPDPPYDSVKQAKKNLASAKERRDAISASLEDAQAALEEARQQMESTTEEEIADAEAALSQAEEAVDSLTEQLKTAKAAVSDARIMLKH